MHPEPPYVCQAEPSLTNPLTNGYWPVTWIGHPVPWRIHRGGNDGFMALLPFCLLSGRIFRRKMRKWCQTV